MAKTIKFNLMLDGKPIRTIEELEENFCINDVLEFYQKGLLQKWLKVRGFDEHLKKVEAISEKISAIIELIKIFEIEISEKEIKEAVYSLEFWEERKVELEEWNKKDHNIKEIIADYHNGYDVLKVDILQNKEDMPFMKSAAKEIFDKYYKIFEIDACYFFRKFKDTSPLIIYAILMNRYLRDMFLKNDDILEELSIFELNELKDESAYEDKDESAYEDLDYNSLTLLAGATFPKGSISINTFVGKLQSEILVRRYVGKTEEYWKDLEVAKTKVMVLSIPERTFVRSANKPKEELSASDVNGKFLILDGLLYKSNNPQSPIVYMEV